MYSCDLKVSVFFNISPLALDHGATTKVPVTEKCYDNKTNKQRLNSVNNFKDVLCICRMNYLNVNRYLL